MNTSTIAWIIVAVVVLLGGWYLWSSQSGSYGYEYGDDTSAPAAQTGAQNTDGSTQTAGTNTSVNVPITDTSVVLNAASHSTLGQYLVTANGMTLYTSNGDTAGVSNCTGTCTDNWPPYIVESRTPLTVKTGIAGKVDTLKRADNGSLQVTYKGMPLYLWDGDLKAGDITGNKIGTFVIAKP